MVDTKVETFGRLARWRIESCTSKRSDPFKLGIWNWDLCVEKGPNVRILLSRELTRVSNSKELPPVAWVLLRVTVASSNRKSFSIRIHEGPFDTIFRFDPVDKTFRGRMIIDVEFLDLKISPLDGGEVVSIWPSEDKMRRLPTPKCISHMVNEPLFSDITINTSDGKKLHAHRAVLSASTSVFHTMFLRDLKEKKSSTISIDDMTSDTCVALLGYIYGTLSKGDFWKHRLALLAAAHKYKIPDLKGACEESLLEDIGFKNVLERLQDAWIYDLDKLKKGCMTYLLDFGKIYDLRKDMNGFLRRADGELVEAMLKEVLAAWQPA